MDNFNLYASKDFQMIVNGLQLAPYTLGEIVDYIIKVNFSWNNYNIRDLFRIAYTLHGRTARGTTRLEDSAELMAAIRFEMAKERDRSSDQDL